MDGGDDRGAPVFPLVYGTRDADRCRSYCGDVGVVFLGGVSIRRQLIWRCNLSTWWVVCVYTHVTDLCREVKGVTLGNYRTD